MINMAVHGLVLVTLRWILLHRQYMQGVWESRMQLHRCSFGDSGAMHCRWDISLVSNVPIGTGFGPQNITVIMSQESHHQHAFFDQNCRNHFPHVLKTET